MSDAHACLTSRGRLKLDYVGRRSGRAEGQPGPATPSPRRTAPPHDALIGDSSVIVKDMSGGANENEGLELREAEVAKREAALAAHRETADRILDAAEVRDEEADARDRESEDRDRAADLKAFTSSDRDRPYGADLQTRRHAALDRHHSQGDRAVASEDRTALTEPYRDSNDPDVPEGRPR